MSMSSRTTTARRLCELLSSSFSYRSHICQVNIDRWFRTNADTLPGDSGHFVASLDRLRACAHGGTQQ